MLVILFLLPCARWHGAGFDWTPELVSADVEENARVEADTLRGEYWHATQRSASSPHLLMAILFDPYVRSKTPSHVRAVATRTNTSV